jgi:hypothetical protein
MPSFTRLIRFNSSEDNEIYFADLGSGVAVPLPAAGAKIEAWKSLDKLLKGNKTASKRVTFDKVNFQ